MTAYPPIGFSLSDLFSLSPDATQRVLSSPYFIYLAVSAVLIGFLGALIFVRYRDSICDFFNHIGLSTFSDFLRRIR